MIELKSPSELDAMRESGRIVGDLHQEFSRRVCPGVTTLELDAFAEEFICSHDGARPVFKGLYGFPGSLCTSINSEVVHGIPSEKRVLQEGDILSIDVGVTLDGWCSDAARTYQVGEVSADARRLVEAAEAALDAAIAVAVPELHVGDIGHAVESAVRPSGFHVIRDLVGHGVGRKVHEDPQVPNLGRPGEGPRLREGMVLAIEPMIAVGTWRIRTLSDGWTMVTTDQSLSTHVEHTVAITADGPRILTVPSEKVAPLT
ncbi:MAG: type I methionyl aminopeptidase [Gemmatimonadales bacterium]|nr:MAG: type I methionyl aminopeptidase [Gemmatimonadales bacterium]